jgi:hypothetical protein
MTWDDLARVEPVPTASPPFGRSARRDSVSIDMPRPPITSVAGPWPLTVTPLTQRPALPLPYRLQLPHSTGHGRMALPSPDGISVGRPVC